MKLSLVVTCCCPGTAKFTNHIDVVLLGWRISSTDMPLPWQLVPCQVKVEAAQVDMHSKDEHVNVKARVLSERPPIVAANRSSEQRVPCCGEIVRPACIKIACLQRSIMKKADRTCLVR